MSLSDADRKKLWGFAGGRCSLCFKPAAEVQLTEAHILPRVPGGPRGGAKTGVPPEN